MNFSTVIFVFTLAQKESKFVTSALNTSSWDVGCHKHRFGTDLVQIMPKLLNQGEQKLLTKPGWVLR